MRFKTALRRTVYPAVSCTSTRTQRRKIKSIRTRWRRPTMALSTVPIPITIGDLNLFSPNFQKFPTVSPIDIRYCSLYNSQSYGSPTASKGSTSLQSSYLGSYATPSSMTQYSSYAGYNSGSTTFPTVPQNMSSASQVWVIVETTF